MLEFFILPGTPEEVQKADIVSVLEAPAAQISIERDEVRYELYWCSGQGRYSDNSWEVDSFHSMSRSAVMHHLQGELDEGAVVTAWMSDSVAWLTVMRANMRIRKSKKL